MTNRAMISTGKEGDSGRGEGRFFGANPGSFKLLVVDDDPDVHLVTRRALTAYFKPGSEPVYIGALSSADARVVLRQHGDLAVILLDVVMESSDSGLSLIHAIRNEFDLGHTQIILRTGQPGYAREEEVVEQYSINGYLNKSDLTSNRLYSAITTAFRAYLQLCQQAKVSSALEELLKTTASHAGTLSFETFALDAMARFADVFDVPCRGFLARQFEKDSLLSIAVATEEFSRLKNQSLDSIGDDALASRIKACHQSGRSIVDDHAATLYLPSARKLPAVMHLICESGDRPINQNLLSILCVTFGGVADNLALANENTKIQTQLMQWEKMASLGLLIANVTHEINTPIGAVKASAEIIAESVEAALSDLPKLFQSLDRDGIERFSRLLPHKSNSPTLSSREERALIGELSRRLEEKKIASPQQIARDLFLINSAVDVVDVMPLLNHPQCRLIIDTARQVSEIMRSSRNISAAISNVAKIILALKNYSRVELQAEMAESSLSAGIETVLTIYQGQLKFGVEVVRQYEDIPPLLCLPDELNQVWTNLIHNALQAMEHSGRLTIGIRREGAEALVSISDTGCGIPQKNMSKIFDVFFTTKPAGVGSGLGLDIVKKIVEKHRGKIKVISEVGVGTTFQVRLPY